MTDKQREAIKHALAERNFWQRRWRATDRVIRGIVEYQECSAFRTLALEKYRWQQRASNAEASCWELRGELAELHRMRAAAIQLLMEVDEAMSRTDTDLDHGCRDRIAGAMAALRAMLQRNGEEGR